MNENVRGKFINIQQIQQNTRRIPTVIIFAQLTRQPTTSNGKVGHLADRDTTLQDATNSCIYRDIGGIGHLERFTVGVYALEHLVVSGIFSAKLGPLICTSNFQRSLDSHTVGSASPAKAIQGSNTSPVISLQQEN